MAKKNDESRESMVSPLLVDKVKVRDFDISSGISSKLEFSKLETVRDLRLRTPKEIRLQTCLPLFDYLELYKYLHSIGIYSYQETDQPPVNNVLSTGIAEGILLREIGLSELTINDLINKANYNESRYKLLTEQEIKRGFDDYSFLNEDRTLLQRNPVEYRRIKTKVSRFTKYIGDNLPFYRDSDYNSDFSRMGRDTYEELLLRMRESGLFSIKDDAYFEKCGEETIGCSFKSVKLTLCHRFSLYDSHFDNKSFAIFNSLGGLFPTECSFPSTVVTVEDLMQLSPQQIKRYLPKKKNRSDQAISKFYCKLLQCGVINHNETLKKCQSLPNIFDRIIYSCIKAMDNKAIEDFNLPQGITTSLINSQIYSFGELRAMTPNDLLNIPGIGPQKVNTINGFIANVWNGIGCHNEIEQKLTD